MAACTTASTTSQDDANRISVLYRRAVAHGYTGQARILKDGKVTFDEYAEAGQALAACATQRGIPLQAVEDWDMRGATVFVQPKVIFHGSAGARATQVTNSCQTREQMLVDEAWQRLRPAISDEAYDLWKACLRRAGFHGEVPRSDYLIYRELDAALVRPCERQVELKLAEKRAPRAL
jgi:hypothetical protein